uniref:Similar to human chromosome 11 open reading frame 86 n=1 Tax=Rattus norvegicus TaxID=10116 RepID=D3ZTJ8_RAT
MGTSLRSQSFREPRPCYGRLHESHGRSLEGRLRRALSLRQGREKSRSQGPNGSEGLEVSVQERLPGTLGDTEQLIQTQRGGSRRWLRQYQQVKRRWRSFVASFPSVTLSQPASPEALLDTNS